MFLFSTYHGQELLECYVIFLTSNITIFVGVPNILVSLPRRFYVCLYISPRPLAKKLRHFGLNKQRLTWFSQISTC